MTALRPLLFQGSLAAALALLASRASVTGFMADETLLAAGAGILVASGIALTISGAPPDGRGQR